MIPQTLRTILPFLLTGGLLASACGDDNKSTANTISNSKSADATTHTPTGDAGALGLDGSVSFPDSGSGLLDSGQTALTDSQIAGVLAKANQGEIDQGDYASTKAKAKPIVDYAKLMVSMHTQAQTDQTALLQTLSLTPADSAVSVMLAGNATQTLDKLKTIDAGDGFDYAYISAQVTQHQSVLDLLDQILIPQASSPVLKTALQTARAMVKSHLDTAQALVATYRAAPDGGVVGSADGGSSTTTVDAGR
ncbi:MAG: rane protein [Myxococcaceae bacterium]|nr:rane protein [Myxococcaceae bacterium]